MVVSVCMITYGHERFIKEAIEGVLMQECDCEFELIIANDCSPDATDQVVEDIMRHHPRGSLIRYKRHAKNIGMLQNFLFVLQQSTGEYIAFCEGDDYWTDPLKIQKQLNVFLADPSVVLVHTDYAIQRMSDGVYTDALNRHKHIPVNSIYNELIEDNFIATLTVMVQTTLLRNATELLKNALHQWPMADYPYWLYVSSKGKIAYLPETTATYRYLSASASHSDNLLKNLKFLQGTFSVRKYFLKHVQPVSPKTTWRINRSFYADTGLYIFRKLKQKIYGKS